MQINIEQFLIKRLNWHTLIWGVIQISDPHLYSEIGLYIHPSYLIFEGKLGDDLTYSVHDELTHWQVFGMLAEKTAGGFSFFNTWQINELDPTLDQTLKKLVVLGKLKM